MTHSSTSPSPQPWHVAAWPPLAWLETAIKLAALALAVTALALTFGGYAFTIPGGIDLVQLVVLVILSLGLVAAIFDRLMERELVAMAFVVANNLGHWGLVWALLHAPGPGGLLTAFCALMLLGDLVKLVFLRVHNFKVRETPQAVLFGLTLIYVAGYAVILALQLLR